MGASGSREQGDEAAAEGLKRLEFGIPPPALAACRNTFAALRDDAALRTQFRLDGFDVSSRIVVAAFPDRQAGTLLQWREFLGGVARWRELASADLAAMVCQVAAEAGSVSLPMLRAMALALSGCGNSPHMELTAQEVAALDGAKSASGARVVGAASLSVEDAAQWASAALPGLGLCLRHHLLWCAYGRPPVPGQDTAQRSGLLTPGLAWSLAMLLGPAGPELPRWLGSTLLYQRSTHGSSSNIFLSKVDGYPGPVLVLFELGPPEGDEGGGEQRLLVGVVVDAALFSPLGLSPQGAASTCLLALAPSLCRFPLKVGAAEAGKRKQDVAYCTGHSRRSASARATTSKEAAGLMGFGGTPTTPRIELDDSGANLTMRRAVKGDLFASGPLVASPAFEGYGAITCPVKEMEVWGLSGEAAQAAQLEARAREERFVEQRKHVDRAAFAEDWENSPDRAILSFAAGGVTGRETARFSKAEEAMLDRHRAKR